jgi:iron complex transport system substrate-binding protein
VGVRVVSLLPSATEIVYALGMDEHLVGVTFECDEPAAARTDKTVVVGGRDTRGMTPREIDRYVRAQVAAGEDLSTLHADALRDLRPEVVLTQDLCRVCALPSGDIEQALDYLGCDADVVSLDPASLQQVLDTVTRVGDRLGVPGRAHGLVLSLRRRLADIAARVAGRPRPRVAVLEWIDPPFAAGHWVPEMVEAAAGVNLLSEKGGPSSVVTHREIRDANPEVIVFMPCGYYLEEAEEEATRVFQHAELQETPAVRNGNVFAVDATSYFSRPGPRIVDGLEILAWALHPDAYPEPPPGRISRVG